MTGPEHYAHAETLLSMASDKPVGSEYERYGIAAAQVHATLATAAATALMTDGAPDDKELDAWISVAATTGLPS